MGIIDEHYLQSMMLTFMTVVDTEWVTTLISIMD